jgi:hypothetical protein
MRITGLLRAIEMIIRDQQVTRPKISQQFLGICDARGAGFRSLPRSETLRGGKYGIVVLEQYKSGRGRGMRYGHDRVGVFEPSANSALRCRTNA